MAAEVVMVAVVEEEERLFVVAMRMHHPVQNLLALAAGDRPGGESTPRDQLPRFSSSFRG